MSEYHHYDENFASHFNTEEFNILSPQQQEHHPNKEGPTETLSVDNSKETTQGSHTLLADGSLENNESTQKNNKDGASAASSTNDSANLDTKKNPKPKRTRATGEALDFLKKEFELNSNPTSQRRKKISELTGLPEKNVRIWFQNRRAKLRKNGQTKGGFGGVADPNTGVSSYDGSNECATYFDRIPLSINNNYYFIDICSITVGSWNRMKSGALRRENLPTIRDLSNLSPISINQIMSNATDLMVLISKKNFEINYFFSAMANNTKILFRIFFSISSVLNCSLSLETNDILESGTRHDNDEDQETNEENDENKFYNGDDENYGGQGSTSLGELKVAVSRPPNFAVYFLDSTDERTNNQWSICEDFSEGRQVNDAFVGGSNIPHALKGSQNSLKFMNSLILDYNSTNQILPPPPLNSQHVHIAEPQPLGLHQQASQTFFDQYDAANDMLSLNRDASGIGEPVINDTIDNRVENSNNNHHANEGNNIMSLSHDSQLPNIPDFFKNPQELTDDHRWL